MKSAIFALCDAVISETVENTTNITIVLYCFYFMMLNATCLLLACSLYPVIVIAPAAAVEAKFFAVEGIVGGGHFGINATQKVSKRFWWPDMSEDIRHSADDWDLHLEARGGSRPSPFRTESTFRRLRNTAFSNYSMGFVLDCHVTLRRTLMWSSTRHNRTRRPCDR